jgi:hypothetical protein
VGTLTDDMKRVVRQQRLAFVATVCADNTPNLSPKVAAAFAGGGQGGDVERMDGDPETTP